MKFLGESVGCDRFLLGTDYPWDVLTTTPMEDLERLETSADVRAGISEENVLQFLRVTTSS